MGSQTQVVRFISMEAKVKSVTLAPHWIFEKGPTLGEPCLRAFTTWGHEAGESAGQRWESSQDQGGDGSEAVWFCVCAHVCSVCIGIFNESHPLTWVKFWWKKIVTLYPWRDMNKLVKSRTFSITQTLATQMWSGPWISNSCITWRLVRDVDLGLHFPPTQSECAFNKISIHHQWVTCLYLKLQKHFSRFQMLLYISSCMN